MEFFSKRELKQIRNFVKETRGKADICLSYGMHGEDLPEEMTPLILDALEAFVNLYETHRRIK